MKFTAAAAFAFVASVVALPGGDWNTWEACTPTTVTVTEKGWDQWKTVTVTVPTTVTVTTQGWEQWKTITQTVTDTVTVTAKPEWNTWAGQ